MAILKVFLPVSLWCGQQKTNQQLHEVLYNEKKKHTFCTRACYYASQCPQINPYRINLLQSMDLLNTF